MMGDRGRSICRAAGNTVDVHPGNRVGQLGPTVVFTNVFTNAGGKPTGIIPFFLNIHTIVQPLHACTW